MSPCPSAFLGQLRAHCPEWVIGAGSRGLLLRHLRTVVRIPELHAVSRQIAWWRWQLVPWDVQGVSLHAAMPLQNDGPDLPEWTHRPPSEPGPAFAPAMQAIAAGNDEQVRRSWLDHGARSGNLAWLGETFLFFLRRGNTDFCRDILRATDLAPNHPLRAHLNALLVFLHDHGDPSDPALVELPTEWTPLRRYLEAERLLRLDPCQGVARLKLLWRDMPWHVNLTLKLHELLTPGPTRVTPGPDVGVLLYSWDNADLLGATLDSLAQSDLSRAGLIVLDNGSTDHTQAIIHNAASLFGERLKFFRLPVNIGAPAARNWLLRHPDTAAFRDIVFLDDDVLLPTDWLSALLAARDRFPRSAVIGCRIMDQQPRTSIQMADVNLLDFETDGDFQIANAGSGELDLGLHTYSRPCLSVTGCCHLMDRERAEKLGGFDLRFSPSQFDDFDLDLRNALDGGHAVYVGSSAIQHCQRSSLNQADSEAKQGHIQGNMIKLNSKYSPEQKRELLRINRELLWADLLTKTKDLENA